MLRFVFSIAFLAGGVFGVFGAASGCSSSGDDTEQTSFPQPDGAAGGGDATVNVDGGNACAPANVQGFEPPKWERLPSAYRGACTDAQLQTFMAACESNPSDKYVGSACAEFRKAEENATCSACIFEPRGKDREPSALVVSALGHLLPNRAACMAHETNDYSPSGCASAYQALVQCELAACTTNCPVSLAGDDTDFVSCAARAAEPPCVAYNKKKTDACAPDAARAVEKCLEVTEYKIVELLCGKRTGDGG